MLWCCLMMPVWAQTLTTLEYRVSGSALEVSPALLSVPKGIAGSVSTRFAGDAALLNGAYLVATLRGGGAPARELLGMPGQPLLLPPLNVAGDYQLDGIQLVRDGPAGRTVLMESSPRSVPVRVFEEVLVTRVTSRPLTSEEIRDKGIYLDESNFRVTEFEVGLVLDGRTIPVKAPVVSPRATQTTELVPASEVAQRLAQAQALNQQIAEQVTLPREVQAAGIQIQGVSFQFTEELGETVGLSVPPIPALLVIPGNIGFLNQFFSVQVFTENAAPAGSGLSVFNVQARLVLPAGTDRVPGSSDDPLRAARVGASAEARTVLPVRGVGPDGKSGTDDDLLRLKPGEGGTCEFLVEGLREGLHVLDLELTADLEGLAAGVVQVRGTASGSVLVRNPRFSLAFSAPRTVRVQEPYWASVTILNTSEAAANEVSVTLPSSAVSGAELMGEPTVRLGTLLPGQSGTARFRLKSLRTGRVRFSNLSFGDEVTSGQFRLSMGVDERGVELSPDSLAMPDDALRLSAGLLEAADRVLGQTLSAVTAPRVPRGVIQPQRPVLRARVLELAEAGQRLRFGDDPVRVYADLLFDWQGGRFFDEGFDQILRETDAGWQWREAVASALHDAGGADADMSGILSHLGPDLAGRGEAWVIVSDDIPAASVSVEVDLGTGVISGTTSPVPRALTYPGPHGSWTVLPGGSDPVQRWRLAQSLTSMRVVRLDLGTNGVGRATELRAGPGVRGGCGVLRGEQLRLDADCDGVSELEVTGVGVEVREAVPRVIRIQQDPTVLAGRPERPCDPPADVLNYGTVLAALFSKPMSAAMGGQAPLFVMDDGNVAQSVQMQPGGRMALVNLSRGVSAIRPRRMRVGEVTDLRGNRMTPVEVGVVHEHRGGLWKEGVAVNGRVLRADGSPAQGVPVTLTMEEEVATMDECVPYTFRVSQVRTDSRGEFTFDFVLAGLRYSVSATDTTGLSAEGVSALVGMDRSEDTRRVLTELAQRNEGTLLAAFAVGSMPDAVALVEGLDRAVVRDRIESVDRHGSTNIVGLQFRGRGTVMGTVYRPGSTEPAANVAVNLFPDPGSRERGRGLMTDAAGRFAFFGVPLGVFTVEVDDGAGHGVTVDGMLSKPGETLGLDIPLLEVPVRLGGISGRVTESDRLTAAPGAMVYVGEVENRRVGRIMAAATVGSDGLFTITRVPEGTWSVVAFSADGSRVGIRDAIRISGGVMTTVSVDLEGFGRLAGRVITPSGVPVPGAVVAGGVRLARTDENGRFEMADIPLGRRTISAAVTPAMNPLVRSSRRGSRQVEVLPGVLNVADVVLDPSGVVKGTVRDEEGNPVPGVRVSKPVEGGFLYVMADERGFYRFEGLSLGEHVFSAPAPPVAKTDVDGILAVLGSQPGEEALQAAIGEAFAIFTGMKDPLLNGEGLAFNPGRWGYNTARLDADDQELTVDITYMKRGSVGGVVRNGQGVLIGARVQLASVGPAPNGFPMIRVAGEMDSDAAAGTWAFENSVRYGGGAIRTVATLPVPGVFRLYCASPFFPVVLELGGQVNEVRPAIRDFEFRFPAPRETQGRIAGRVFNPDGTGAADGVRVIIPFEGSIGVTAEMMERGFREADVRNPVTQEVGADLGPAGKAVAPEFPPTAQLPAPRSYEVYALDPRTGAVGRSVVQLEPGTTQSIDVRLLGTGSLVVRVTDASGGVMTGADVRVQATGFPYGRFDAITDATGQVRIEGVVENRYEIVASALTGASRAEGRSVLDVVRGNLSTGEIRLAASGSVAGSYLRRDGTPVVGASVRVSGFLTATDSTGSYRVTGVPLGTYSVRSEDPVTGLGVEGSGTLTQNGGVVRVDLREPFLGEVVGSVLDSFRTGTVPGAGVVLVHASGLHPTRRATTDAAGRFRFAGVPAGEFRLEASNPRTGVTGSATGRVLETVASVTVHVALDPRTNLRVTVRDVRGNPASAAVRLAIGLTVMEGDTGGDGVAVFGAVPLGSCRVTARSLATVGSQDVGSTTLALTQAGESAVEVSLRGSGETTGRVFLADGITPVAEGTEVQLTGLASELSELGELPQVTLTDAAGGFRFAQVASGDNRLLVRVGGLSATATYSQPDGVVFQQNLVLSAVGTVVGRVLRANGTPAARVQATLLFGSRGGLTDRATWETGLDGVFELRDVPLGRDLPLRLSAVGFDGIRDVRATVVSNGERVDVGDLVLDEAPPRLVATIPADNAVDVPTAAVLFLEFNEAMDPSTLGDGGIRLFESVSGAPVAFAAKLESDSSGVARRVRIVPAAPLRSETRYGLVLVPVVPRPGGGMDTGPKDLAGRLPDRSSLITFLTADNEPPRIVSVFPANGEVNVNIGTLTNALTPRVSFNEPVRDGVTMVLSGPDGIVAGTAEVSVGGRVARLLTDRLLRSNTRYTLLVSNVVDLAGNAALGQPFISVFDSVDDLGPELSELRLRGGVSPVAGRRVELEAVLADAEDGVRVRFFSGLTNPLGAASTPPFRIVTTLPREGAVVFTAVAQDRFGNDGTIRRLVMETVPDRPPTLGLELVAPAEQPVTRGQPFRIRVVGEDDVAVESLRLVANGPISSVQTVSGGLLEASFTLPNSAPVTGSLEFEVEAVDSAGQSTRRLFPVAWRKVNQAPVALATTQPATEGRLRVTVGVSDADDDPVAVDVLSMGAGIRVFQTPDGVTLGEEIRGPGARLTDPLGRVLVEVGPRFAGTVQLAFRATDGEAFSEPALVLVPWRGTAWVSATGVYGTGLDPEGKPLSAGAVDPHYRLLSNPDGAGTHAVALSADSAWIGNSASSQWLVPRGDTGSAASGTYEYAVEWSATDVIAETIEVDGVWATDDEGVDILVNGRPTSVKSAGFTRFSPFHLTGNFVQGTNRLVFRVHNVGGPTGLRVDGLRAVGLRRSLFAGKDADADGMDDAQELAQGLNPEDPADAARDADGDGLANAEELNRGTNPWRADTDDDGLPDGVEVAGGCSDPTRADTDGDGLKDGVDSDPCRVATAPVLGAVSGLEAVQGVETSWAFVATDADGNLVRWDAEMAGGAGELRTEIYALGVGLSLLAEMGLDQRTPQVVLMGGAIDYRVGSGAFATGAPSDQFGVRIDGGVRIPREGDWTFHLTSDDGSVLTMNGETWIVNDGLHPDVTRSTTRRLVAGLIPFRVEMFENGGGATLVLEWEGPGQPRQVIPESAFAPTTRMEWAEGLSGSRKWTVTPPAARSQATLRFISETAGVQTLNLRATDSDGLVASVSVPVLVLPDLDGDRIPDRDDGDVDGDGLTNDDERIRGTDPRRADSDGDTLLDGMEVAGGTDPLRSDTDGDGIPDALDPFPNSNNLPPRAGEKLPYVSDALRLDGVTGAVDGPLLREIADSFTFEFWVRPETSRGSIAETGTGTQAQSLGAFAVFPAHGSGLGGGAHAGAGVSVGLNGIAIVEHAADYFPAPLVYDTALSGWSHVAVVYESGRPILYLNGERVRVGTASTRTVHPSAGFSSALGRFKGHIDEFRIWDRVRTADQIRAFHRQRASGLETGLALLWRMDETTAGIVEDGSGHGRRGVFAAGVQRLSGAPLLEAWGVRETTEVGLARLIRLPALDPENQPLKTRLASLPVSGRLFQFSGSGPGGEILSPGASVEDPERRVVYVPAAGFLGSDGFGYSVADAEYTSEPVEARVEVVSATSPVSDDVWDVSQGITLLGNSGIHPLSAVGNMFGGTGGVEPMNTLFRDDAPPGTMHTVEWRTPGPVLLEGVRLFVADDQPAGANRGITEVRLHGKAGAADAYQLLGSYRLPSNPYFGGQRFQARIDLSPFVGQYFRAEFDAVPASAYGGPRIEELDAIGESVVMVPAARTVVLRNATSDGSQGGFSPAEAIDGMVEGAWTQNGWAGETGGTPALTAVFETDSDLAVTRSTEFHFTMVQPYGSGHSLGRFRISATTDSRDLFADGLANGGDVDATWIPLDVVRVTGTSGEVFQVLGDGSVRVDGPFPAATTYVVTTRGIDGHVTGFRLEAMEDPSLPNGGPGRAGNGNWVLNEFGVDFQGGVAVANRAPRGQADEGVTFQGTPVVIRPLANDIDPEGDLLRLGDVTPPPVSVGSLVAGGDGTLTFTPAREFVGVTTLFYRPADPYQLGKTTGIRVSVSARLPVITSAASAAGRLGQKLGYAITAENFPTGYSAKGLPPGLVLDGATGRIEGVPTVVGTYSVVVSASNSAGETQLNVQMVISPEVRTLIDTFGAGDSFGLDPFGVGSAGASFFGMSASDPDATGGLAALSFRVPADGDVMIESVSAALSQDRGEVNVQWVILENRAAFAADGSPVDSPGAVLGVVGARPVLGAVPEVRTFVPSSPLILRAGNRYWLQLGPESMGGAGSTRWHRGMSTEGGEGLMAVGSWDRSSRSFALSVSAGVVLPAARVLGVPAPSVPNGDFELPVLAAGSSVTLASQGGAFAGWSASGDEAGRVAIVSTGGSGAAVPDLNGTRRGRQAIVSRDGADFSCRVERLVPGATYRLLYAEKQVRLNGRFTPLPGGAVFVDGVPVGFMIPTDSSSAVFSTLQSKPGGFVKRTDYFTATATTARIDFRPDDLPGVTDHVCIDDLRIEWVEPLGLNRWKRQEQWTEGTSAMSSAGNPAPDGRGNSTWSYQWTDNMRDGTTPFYAAARIPMVWDPSWLGILPLWASGNDTVPVVWKAGAICANYRQAPVIGWIKPPGGSSTVQVHGRIDLSWYATNGVPFPQPVFLSVVKVDVRGAMTELLYRVLSPFEGAFPGEVSVPVDLPAVEMQAGDRIQVSCLLDIPASRPTFGVVWMSDDLVFTVQVSQGPGSVPVVSLASTAFLPGSRAAGPASSAMPSVSPKILLKPAPDRLLPIAYSISQGAHVGSVQNVLAAPGAESITLPTVMPSRVDALAPPEVVRVRILRGDGYDLGSAVDETHVLAGSEFARWQADRLSTEQILAGLGEADADANGDGESNLWEFATDGQGRLTARMEGGVPVFEHVRRSGAFSGKAGVFESGGLRYLLETSSDLRSWEVSEAGIHVLRVQALSNGFERVTVSLPSSGRFVRLRIVPVP